MSALTATVSDPGIVKAVVRFTAQPTVSRDLDLLQKKLPPNAAIFIAGGALRNIVMTALHGSAPPTVDIDIFIGGLRPDFALFQALAGEKLETTDLKGVRWHPGDSQFSFDLCRLQDFIVIEAGGFKPTRENLLRGIDFSINAIVYDCKHNILSERGCTADVRKRRIAFNSSVIPDKKLMGYRIVLMAHKTGFALSRTVFQFVRDRLDLETVIELKRLFKAKLGGAMATALMQTYDRICQSPAYDVYLAERETKKP